MNQRYRPDASLFSHATTAPETDSAAAHGAIERPVFSSDSVTHLPAPDDSDTETRGS